MYNVEKFVAPLLYNRNRCHVGRGFLFSYLLLTCFHLQYFFFCTGSKKKKKNRRRVSGIMSLNPGASSFVPRWLKKTKRVMTREEIRALRDPALALERSRGVTTFHPFTHIPHSLPPLLQCRHFEEFVDVDAASSLVEDIQVAVDPSLVNYYCVECAQGPNPCGRVADLIVGVRRKLQQTRIGAFLFQPGDVVMGLVQLHLVFESRKTSMKMKLLAEKAKDAVTRIREFLCGEGFHVLPPPVAQHDQWRRMMQLLMFDWIRDNRTRIFTELSKYWKKSHTQFEQFAHFLFYRDDRPAHVVRNMLTHSQKPVMVAVIGGSLDAVVVLSELGFFVPPDYFWASFPFFKETLEGTMGHVLRHLCVHYYQRQSTRSTSPFNPILPPSPPIQAQQAPAA